jgi:predicted PurR-regulated permease PerM
VVLLTLLASLALLWVLWQLLSPILHTLVLFALAAVLAFGLGGPVGMLAARLRGNRVVAIVLVYVLFGVIVVGGLILLAGLLGGLFAVPVAGVVWVLITAGYRNAMAAPTIGHGRGWALSRWRRPPGTRLT